MAVPAKILRHVGCARDGEHQQTGEKQARKPDEVLDILERWLHARSSRNYTAIADVRLQRADPHTVHEFR